MPKWKSSGIASRPGSDAILAIAINTSSTIIAAGHFDGTVVAYDSSNMGMLKFSFNLSLERYLSASGEGGGDVQISSKVMMENPQYKSPITGLVFRPKCPSAAVAAVAASLPDSSVAKKQKKEDEEEVLIVTTSDGIVERRVINIASPSISVALTPAFASSSSPNSASLSPISTSSYRPCTVKARSFQEYSSFDAASDDDADDNDDGGDADENSTIQTKKKNKKKKPNEVYAVCYNKDGKLFATCGLDATVRVYDDATLSLLHTLETASSYAFASSASSSSLSSTAALRLQCVRFSDANPNIVIAGGWSQTIHFWDLSTATSATGNNSTNYSHLVVHNGPYAIGQGIDCRYGEVLAVSFRGQDRLQTMVEPVTIPTAQEQAALTRRTSSLLSLNANRPRANSSGNTKDETTAAANNTNSGASANAATTPAAPENPYKLKPLPWPTSNNNVNFFPTCVAISPKSAVDGEYFIAMGGGGGMGLTEASMILSGVTKEVVGEYLAVGCVNCCAFGAVSSHPPSSATASSSHRDMSGSLLVAFGDSKGNVQAARYMQ